MNISARTKEEVLKAIQSRFVNFADFDPRRCGRRKASLPPPGSSRAHARAPATSAAAFAGGDPLIRSKSKFAIPGLHQAAVATMASIPSAKSRLSVSVSHSTQLQAPIGTPPGKERRLSQSRGRADSEGSSEPLGQGPEVNLDSIDETPHNTNSRALPSRAASPSSNGSSVGTNISPRAPRTLDPVAQIDLVDRLPKDLFERAQKQVYELMRRDSFKRWRNLRRKSIHCSNV